MKVIPRANPFVDAKVTLPKYPFILSIHLRHTFHLINRGLLKEMSILHLLSHCLLNHNRNRRLRHQHYMAALKVIPRLPHPFADAKVTLTKRLFLLSIHRQNIHHMFHLINRILLKELSILYPLTRCLYLNNQESTKAT